MILEVDIGNTRLKWRLLNLAGQVSRRGAVGLNEFEEFEGQLADQPVMTVRASCVAGVRAEEDLSLLCQRLWQTTPSFARVVDGIGGVAIGYSSPSRLGVDRWLAMIAGYHQLSSACVVIDAGSAVTADFISNDGQHLGGLILPGARLMRDALLAHTDAVKPGPLTLPQKWMPGCDTLSCVENGVVAALTGLVAEISDYAESQCGAGVRYMVCGGDANALACHDTRLTVCADLVLDGLAIALG